MQRCVSPGLNRDDLRWRPLGSPGYHSRVSGPQLHVDALWARTQPNEQGLVPCITQDLRTRAVLMMAWVSKEALAHALTSGFATYWSRSRQVIWEKGKSSGHHQRLMHVRLDCDGDTLLYLVEARLPACHEGTDTCFSRRRVGNGWSREPVELNKNSAADATPEANSGWPAQGSPPLPGGGLGPPTQALEAALATDDDARVIARATDLIFDVATALRARKLSFRLVYRELERRLGDR